MCRERVLATAGSQLSFGGFLFLLACRQQQRDSIGFGCEEVVIQLYHCQLVANRLLHGLSFDLLLVGVRSHWQKVADRAFSHSVARGEIEFLLGAFKRRRRRLLWQRHVINNISIDWTLELLSWR